MRPNCTQTQRQECNAIAAMLNDVATESYEELRAIRRTVLGQQLKTEIDTGHALEWHVVLPKSLQHCSFELVPWLHHSIVLLLSAFSLAWFNAIGSVSDPMSNDSVEQPIVEAAAAR